MEHIELAGIHSGDSACVIPPISIPAKHLDTIYEYTRRIAVELNVVGLMNIQYAIANDTVYILEANPRASRTVPLVSKVCSISMARIATQVMLGKRLADLDLKRQSIPHFGVKEAVFPFNMFGAGDEINRGGSRHGRLFRSRFLQGPRGRPATFTFGGKRSDHRV
jgi:carbamoyl-phosphate synthase large subunit